MPPDAIANRWNLPHLGMGLGLRGKHIPHILAQRPAIGWLEVITDNALVHRGWLRHALDQLAERYPLVLHGVTANLGSTSPLDLDYLRGVKALADRWQVPWVSDHLCWTGVGGVQSHDLLPLPYNEETLAWLVDRVRRVQDVLERPLVVENPSSYMQFRDTTLSEWQFLRALAEEADCGILLDVNNVYVAAKNHGFDWRDYLAAMPWSRVCQMHVAGHTTLATHLFDSHIGPVDAPVWDVLRAAFAACGGRPLLLEWDFAIPSLPRCWREAERAWARVADLVVAAPDPGAPAQPLVERAAPGALAIPGDRQELRLPANASPAGPPQRLSALLHAMLDAIRDQPSGRGAAAWLRDEGPLTPDARLAIHREMYAARCDDALREDYPRLRKRLGAQRFAEACAGYRRDVASLSWALEHWGAQLPDWLAAHGHGAEIVALARLERARTDAHLAPEEAPLQPADLAALPADASGWRLRFAPAVHVIQGAGRTWLVARASWQVNHKRLQRVEAALLAALRGGDTLATAMASAAVRPADAALLRRRIGAWLADWVRRGAITGVDADAADGGVVHTPTPAQVPPAGARRVSADTAGLARAVQALLAGELVAIPTETVYGLAGLAHDPRALARIFAAKGRPEFDPLIAHVAPAPAGQRLQALVDQGLLDAQRLTPAAAATATRLVDAFWPGPLTLVLPKAPQVPDLCTAGLPDVAVRMPAHPVAQALLRAVGRPLAAPSANLFGHISPTTAAHVQAELGTRIGWVVDGGPCEVGVESTVVAVHADGSVTLLRPGGIARGDLARVVGQDLHAPASAPADATRPSASPGALASHYAPRKPLRRLPAPLADVLADATARRELGPHDGFLVIHAAPALAPTQKAEVLAPDGSDLTAAQRLFACLRALDATDAPCLWAEPVTAQDGLWPAIADRLARASAPRADLCYTAPPEADDARPVQPE